MYKSLLSLFFYIWVSLVFQKIFINFSIHFYFYFLNIQIPFYLYFGHIWFIFFMSLIFFFLIFLLAKKIIAHDKYIYLTIFYLIILILVIFIILVDECTTFLILFESLFFPVVFSSLSFTFNNRFIFALYHLIFYSAWSSVCCISAIVLLIFHFNTFNLTIFNEFNFFDSFFILFNIWLFLFIMFAIKFPLWPFHSWLPEIHVEVTTEFSTILASIVLKIGFFGFYKFIFTNLNSISIWLIGFLDSIILGGLLFISLLIFFTTDYKKIIAFWSIIHTGTSLILLWHNDIIFILILFFCNLGHILSAGFLFISIGYMYDNFGLRVFLILTGFFGISIWSHIFLLLFLFNIDFPFMLLFYVDLLLLYGISGLSYIYIYIFLLIMFIIFISSLFIYVNLTFYSFTWLDKFIRLDLSINDVFFFTISGLIIFFFFFIFYNII